MFLKKIRNWMIQRKTRVLMKNTVDKDLQTMLLPLNLIPNIMLSPKYSIRKNLIKPNSIAFHVAGFCAVFIYTSFYVYRIYYINVEIPMNFTAPNICCYFDVFFYFYGFFMCFVVSVMKTRTNIEFVLNYQEVHTFFGSRTNIKNFSLWNWISVILIIIWYFGLTVFSIITGAPIHVCMIDLVIIIIDANTIYATRLIKLLDNVIVLINSEIQSLACFEVGKENCKKLFKAYYDIIKCYNILVTSFQQFVSFIAVLIFETFPVCIDFTQKVFMYFDRCSLYSNSPLGIPYITIWIHLIIKLL